VRTIESHKVNPANDVISITVRDAPGAGGANHRYDIAGFDTTNNPSNGEVSPAIAATGVALLFQNGPIASAGVNGLTHEVLLAVLIDRLQSFQKGPYACRENALALTKMEEAQMWLQKRTRDRMARGVEGTHEK
jgi:hypothetical protein